MTQYDVEQEHAARRIGRLGGEALQPRPEVDHRVWTADRVLVVAQVQHHVTRPAFTERRADSWTAAGCWTVPGRASADAIDHGLRRTASRR